MNSVFTLRWTRRAAEEYERLRVHAGGAGGGGRKKSSRTEGLFKQVHKALGLLRANPRHPGLQTHEYYSLRNPFSDKDKVFEAYAQNRTPGAYRIFWCYGPGKGELTIIAITPHP